MIPKWLYYLLNVTAYPLAIYLAIWLSNNVRYDPQGMAGGYQMLYYAMVASAYSHRTNWSAAAGLQ